jgi:MiaB-like tRNA modifying enzyme
MQKQVFIETYGCTLNHADSDIMENLLKSAGYKIISDINNNPNYIILNTCTVKSATEQKIINRINNLKNFKKKLIITGCMASANFDKIKKIAPNSIILPTSKVNTIVEAIAGKEIQKFSKIDKSKFIPAIGGVITRIPISEGCLSNCAFCETKYARGPLNSFSDKLLLKAIEINVAKGTKEIELTSQDTGAYGSDTKTNIAELVSNATKIEGNFKIRIGMLNPEHLYKYFDLLMETYKSDKVYKFLHIPVQSGNDKVLKDMKRRYTKEEFINYCTEARKKIKGMNISTDIIVGYPTETNSAFLETIDLLSDIKPETINISKFSARPHAPARKLKQLSSEIIKYRSIMISRVARRIQKEIRENQIGSVKRTLITEISKTPTGRDDYYQQIAITKGKVCIGDSVNVKITGATQACMVGELIDK